GLSWPPTLERLRAAVGWPSLSVDSIEDRLDVEAFQLGGDISSDERRWDWWQANDLDEESSLGHLDALIFGRSYVTVSAGESPGDPPLSAVELATSMAVGLAA